MGNLVVDIGNSRNKLAVFNNRDLIHTEIINLQDRLRLAELIQKYNITHSIISSVNQEITDLENYLEQKTAYIRFSASVKSPVTITYKTPHTLGLDRLAAVIAARALNPAGSSLVIDAGTCITYDAIDENGIYPGGSISPGLNMRLKAMHSFTGRLPQVEVDENFSSPAGNDTVSSMLSGALNGAVMEVEGFISKYVSLYPGLKVMLCGGDSNFFDTRLKSSIFAHTLKTEPHLVLIGLNEVIHHNND